MQNELMIVLELSGYFFFYQLKDLFAFLCCGLGLKRDGKSCRLRWMNYLSPTVKRGAFSEEEDDLIIRLHKLLGNRFLFNLV